MNPIAERLINFSVYEKNEELLGVADVQLPSIEYLSDTIKGSGIVGEIAVPIFGHLAAMSMSINWRTLARTAVHLARPGVHHLEFWGATQVQDGGTGEYEVVSTKVVVRGMPKKVDIGKLDVGTASDTSSEFELTYIKIMYDGETAVEIDKLNYICMFDGVDYLEKVRRALGKY